MNRGKLCLRRMWVCTPPPLGQAKAMGSGQASYRSFVPPPPLSRVKSHGKWVERSADEKWKVAPIPCSCSVLQGKSSLGTSQIRGSLCDHIHPHSLHWPPSGRTRQVQEVSSVTSDYVNKRINMDSSSPGDRISSTLLEDGVMIRWQVWHALFTPADDVLKLLSTSCDARSSPQTDWRLSNPGVTCCDVLKLLSTSCDARSSPQTDVSQTQVWHAVMYSSSSPPPVTRALHPRLTTCCDVLKLLSTSCDARSSPRRSSSSPPVTLHLDCLSNPGVKCTQAPLHLLWEDGVMTRWQDVVWCCDVLKLLSTSCDARSSLWLTSLKPRCDMLWCTQAPLHLLWRALFTPDWRLSNPGVTCCDVLKLLSTSCDARSSPQTDVSQTQVWLDAVMYSSSSPPPVTRALHCDWRLSNPGVTCCDVLKLLSTSCDARSSPQTDVSQTQVWHAVMYSSSSPPPVTRALHCDWRLSNPGVTCCDVLKLLSTSCDARSSPQTDVSQTQVWHAVMYSSSSPPPVTRALHCDWRLSNPGVTCCDVLKLLSTSCDARSSPQTDVSQTQVWHAVMYSSSSPPPVTRALHPRLTSLKPRCDMLWCTQAPLHLLWRALFTPDWRLSNPGVTCCDVLKLLSTSCDARSSPQTDVSQTQVWHAVMYSSSSPPPVTRALHCDWRLSNPGVTCCDVLKLLSTSCDARSSPQTDVSQTQVWHAVMYSSSSPPPVTRALHCDWRLSNPGVKNY